MIFQESVGIDIRSDTIRLIFLKGSFKGIEVVGQGTFDIDASPTNTDKIKKIAAIYDQFRSANGIGDCDVYVGLPRELFFVRLLTFPLAVKENIASTLHYEMDKFVPMPVDDIYFDFFLHGESKSSNTIKVLLVVARKRDLAPYLDLCHFIKPGISAFKPGAISMINALSHLSVTPAPYNGALVHVDRNTIEVDLVKDGISHGWRINESPGAGAGDCGSWIEQELAAWADGPDAEINSGALQVSLWGAGASDQLVREIRKGSAFAVAPLAYDPLTLSDPLLTAAYGLALEGHKQVPMNINLLPGTMRRRKSRIGLYTMFALVALLLVSFGAWGFSRTLHQRMVLDRMGAEIEHLKTDVKHVQKLEADIVEIEQQILYLNTLTAGYTPVSELMKALTGSIPTSDWINNLTIKGGDVKIKGVSRSASDLLTRLENAPLFKDVKFLSAIVKQKDGSESFHIGLRVNKP